MKKIRMKKDQSIHKLNRILLIISAVVLLIVVWLPIWRIDLTAPQYPEGLRLLIYPNRLAGDVNIVNGLNHYIGMKSLHDADFPEFTTLPGIFIFFSIVALITALLNKKWLLHVFFLLFLVFGIIAMIDFWKWEYDYGHHLNPDAPIIVPGMAYQPPLIGFKQLLNFRAYSIPAIGGWLFVGVGVLLLSINIAEVYRSKKRNIMVRNPLVLLAILFSATMLFSSCNQSTSPIILGKDNCSFCKMPISDARFGGEIITNKGKVYKFDDMHCLLNFLPSDELKSAKDLSFYFVDFSGSHSLIPESKALFYRSEMLKSPMNGNIAVFNNADSLSVIEQQFKGDILHWAELVKR